MANSDDTSSVRTLDRKVHPPNLHPPYRSTVKRAPSQLLVPLPHQLAERTGPVFGSDFVEPIDADLTQNARTTGDALGERIIISGRVTDDRGHAVKRALLEVWQANSAGRYVHKNDDHAAPLDPNFTGAGRCMTDENGDYAFTTIRPGAYPWPNHENAWRPPHVHFSVFGRTFLQRLVTQMYFPGDPLLAMDPIYNSLPDDAGRSRLIARYDHELTQADWALGYRFDIVIGGDRSTPLEENS